MQPSLRGGKQCGRTATPQERQWWGRPEVPGTPPSVRELVSTKVLLPSVAGLLLALIERRMPLSVVSQDAGVGKTTLLTALLAELRPDGGRVYLRGCYESFDFAWDPALAPRETALLINEISPHLPFYLWGPAVARTFKLVRRGYTVYATAHAGSATQLVELLADAPLGVPLHDIASLGIVVTLDSGSPAADGDSVRRVTSCTGLSLAPGGQRVDEFKLAHVCDDGAAAIIDPAEVASWQARCLPRDGALLHAVDTHARAFATTVAYRSPPGC